MFIVGIFMSQLEAETTSVEQAFRHFEFLCSFAPSRAICKGCQNLRNPLDDTLKVYGAMRTLTSHQLAVLTFFL